jgi:hypothetical protein
MIPIYTDPAYELSGKERDIYEHSLTEREVEMYLRKQALRRKLNRIETGQATGQVEDLQPGETPTDDIDFDYSRIDGK